jgi:hypothetical protein
MDSFNSMLVDPLLNSNACASSSGERTGALLAGLAVPAFTLVLAAVTLAVFPVLAVVPRFAVVPALAVVVVFTVVPVFAVFGAVAVSAVVGVLVLLVVVMVDVFPCL